MTLFSDVDREGESRSSRCWVPVGGSVFGLFEPFCSLAGWDLRIKGTLKRSHLRGQGWKRS